MNNRLLSATILGTLLFAGPALAESIRYVPQNPVFGERDQQFRHAHADGGGGGGGVRVGGGVKKKPQETPIYTTPPNPIANGPDPIAHNPYTGTSVTSGGAGGNLTNNMASINDGGGVGDPNPPTDVPTTVKPDVPIIEPPRPVSPVTQHPNDHMLPGGRQVKRPHAF